MFVAVFTIGHCAVILLSHSVQNPMSSISLSGNINIKIDRTLIFAAVLYGCECRPLTPREERRLVLQNKVLRKIFGSKGDVEGRGEGGEK
jgi:hypothetical protein